MIRPSQLTAGHPANPVHTITPARRVGKAGFRKVGLAVLLLSATALAGCATTQKPPEIAYDDAAPAVRTVDAPAPRHCRRTAASIAVARPDEAGGAIPPCARADRSGRPRQSGERRRPHSACPRRLHQRHAGLSLHRRALYQVYTAVGQITDIALQPGETLVGSGPVAAGDTVRWIIGDTLSGSGATQQVHILVKPTRTELMTNLIINTNMRTYHMELRSTERTYMASVSWQYPQDQLIVLRRQNSQAEAAQPIASGVDLANVNFRYAIEGDRAPWRPLRAFDDGRQVFIEFPRGIAQGEMPPLFVVGPEGNTSELVNYRVRDRHMIVDRLFAAAELRFGTGDTQRRVRITRTDGEAGIVSEIDPDKSAKPEPTPEPSDDDARPLTGEPVVPMRLRAEPPRVTRLSRKVLAGLGLVSSLSIGGALIYALQTRDGGGGNTELHSTENRATADGLAGLPKDYTGPVLGPALPGDLGRPILDAQNRGQPVPGPGIGTPAATPPGLSAEEQRRLQEIEAARTGRLFASTETRNTGQPATTTPNATAPMPDLTSLGLAPQPTTPTAQDRQTAFLDQGADRRTVAPDRVGRAGVAEHPSSRRGHSGRAHHRHPFRSAGPDHRPGHGERL